MHRHQYEVTGDFTNLRGLIDKMPDGARKEKILQKTETRGIVLNVQIETREIGLNVQIGEAAPAFGRSGGDLQIEMPHSVEELIWLGVLTEVL